MSTLVNSSSVSSTTAKPAFVSSTTQNSRSYTKSLDSGAIAGLTIGCFLAVAIIISICYCLNRKYKFFSKISRKKKRKENAIPLSTVVTTPNVRRPIPNRPPLIRYDKPADFIPGKPAVKPNERSLPHLHPGKPYRSVDCTENTCIQYSKSLALDRKYFNFKYNKCYCPKCYTASKLDAYSVANSIYTAPRGWARVGLQIDETFAQSGDIFRTWCTTFYGTSTDKLESILNNRFVPFPGDRLLSGEVFSTHLSDKRHVYTSPSIHYASLKHVCGTKTTKIDNEWYEVQIVLECKQNPMGIVKQQGCRTNVCPIISDNEIEWKTDQRSSIIPYGLLIRAKKHQCPVGCKHGHIPERSNPLPVLNPLSDESRHHVKRKPDVVASTPIQRRVDQCPQPICKQYSMNLGIAPVYFKFKYNKCFCSQCYLKTETDVFRVANSRYTVPRGWMRFGLRTDQAFADAGKLFKQWYTTFYGTSKDKVESILNNRFVPFPGDRLLSGEVFSTHLSDKHHVYTSPSIHYASLSHICPTDTTKINNEWYDVKIVLECKQNPQGIVKQEGCRTNVCPIISDNEIEWKTDQRSSIIPYGLLIRAKKHQCTDKCSIKHS